MSTLAVQLTLEQIRDAIRSLQPVEQAYLIELLDRELHGEALRARARQAVAEIREAYANIPPAEVADDVDAAVAEVRVIRHAHRG
ncbi:MAG: hypothetical protein HZB53_18510 [Chloroflexi bacterium]|nr:hypothetical protein [Chloroflexota bacterium]